MTAVEWLHIEFQKRFPKETTEMYNNNQFDYEDMIIKAKEMEKQQIIDAYNNAEDKCEYFIEEHAWQRYHHLSENYYKQTFKSEKYEKNTNDSDLL